MAEAGATESGTEPNAPDAAVDAAAAVEGGNYELLRRRLLAQANELAAKADTLNTGRTEVFGGSELTVLDSPRVRTENNCIARDIVQIGGLLLFGYNVSLHLRSEMKVADVFSLHRMEVDDEDRFDFPREPIDSLGGFLTDRRFQEDFAETYRYYKGAQLLQLRRDETRLLAVFQIGATIRDIRVFQWSIDATGRPTYIDNRGERFHTFPPQHGFEWTPTSRADHVPGPHPHVSIADQVFVETVGGDLTVKIEDNTESGRGIYAEPVDDPDQALDDARIEYKLLGSLILLKILPFREEAWRYLVYNKRTQQAVRIDAIGQACVELPEEHGVIFPGGYYLQTGEYKVFHGETRDLELKRQIRSPNGEDALFVFHRRLDGAYVLFPYNLVRKEVQNHIPCHGYSLFDDGRLVVAQSPTEPKKSHDMQVFQTSFMSAEHAASRPTDGSLLSRIGNADLVRGISDAYTLCTLIRDLEPTRQAYEDIVASTHRLVDGYHWLRDQEVGDLASTVVAVRGTAELIIDEFEKVLAIKRRAAEALAEASEKQRAILRSLRPEQWKTIDAFMGALADLRNQRGHLITLRDQRYIDLEAIDGLEQETIAAFDRVSQGAVRFLLGEEALTPLTAQLEGLLSEIESVAKTPELAPLTETLDGVNQGLDVLSEVVGGLEADDPTAKTTILERISEVFGQVNRVRATLDNRRRALQSTEGRAEFAAQFKLFGQSVTSGLGLCDTAEKCDEQLSRLMVQLEEIESRFSEFDEYLEELASKREEVYDAFNAKKQTLLDARQRRIENLAKAAGRILEGIGRRARAFTEQDELNAFFASDAMVLKLRQLGEQLRELGDSVKADELDARIKAARQEALRTLRDKIDLYEGGDNVIKLGRHRFSVNTESLELTMVPRGDGMALHLTGTDFYEPVTDEDFAATRGFWSQQLISETAEVYRGEYLAASIFLGAEAGRADLTLTGLMEATRSEGGLIDIVRRTAAERYDEGYERGLHDADAAAILDKLLALQATAGLLRYSPTSRALGCLFWAFYCGADDDVAAKRRQRWHRRARSLGRLSRSMSHRDAENELASELAEAIGGFLETQSIEAAAAEVQLAGRYLLAELAAEHPRFVTSSEAVGLRDALLGRLDKDGSRDAFEDDLRALEGQLSDAFELARAWVEAFVAQHPDEAGNQAPAVLETSVLLLTERQIDRDVSNALTATRVTGLLGRHARIEGGALALRLDEFLERLGRALHRGAPAFKEYRRLRHALLERERARLRLDEFKPRVMTTFVRNKLINDVYLPMVGDNLAKQMGTVGADKRTDLMGLLLLISPPGYGKTTLMEYIANRLGLVFMKVNGPSLGHAVHSLDPDEAPNATARQEVEKINLAFEMGNNVMLYLDDIQHTHSELLQKFISLCDAQRRVEGVWRGRTRTYDLKGKKFCVVMAGNPYTESGEKFQIPDMLANRADTYNLGDVLEGKDEAFALSYIENALTSSAALAPLAARGQDDVYKLIRMARGEPLPASELSYNYAASELADIRSVLQKLFVVQQTVLAVNQQYIASASQDDAFRTEPAFKLQGSYRNMNRMAEKVMPAMNDAELEALLDDHYVGEAQTLTTGAEQNLLKLAELRGRLSDEQRARWDEIRREYRRLKSLGGSDEDPVVRVTRQLSVLGEGLDKIGSAVDQAVARAGEHAAKERHAETEARAATADLTQRLEALRLEEDVRAAQSSGGGGVPAELIEVLAGLQKSIDKVARPKFDVQVTSLPPAGVELLLEKQADIVEKTLVPLIQATTGNLADGRALGGKLDELVELLRLVDERLRHGLAVTQADVSKRKAKGGKSKS